MDSLEAVCSLYTISDSASRLLDESMCFNALRWTSSSRTGRAVSAMVEYMWPCLRLRLQLCAPSGLQEFKGGKNKNAGPNRQ